MELRYRLDYPNYYGFDGSGNLQLLLGLYEFMLQISGRTDAVQAMARMKASVGQDIVQTRAIPPGGQLAEALVEDKLNEQHVYNLINELQPQMWVPSFLQLLVEFLGGSIKSCFQPIVWIIRQVTQQSAAGHGASPKRSAAMSKTLGHRQLPHLETNTKTPASAPASPSSHDARRTLPDGEPPSPYKDRYPALYRFVQSHEAALRRPDSPINRAEVFIGEEEEGAQRVALGLRSSSRTASPVGSTEPVTLVLSDRQACIEALSSFVEPGYGYHRGFVQRFLAQCSQDEAASRSGCSERVLVAYALYAAAWQTVLELEARKLRDPTLLQHIDKTSDAFLSLMAGLLNDPIRYFGCNPLRKREFENLPQAVMTLFQYHVAATIEKMGVGDMKPVTHCRVRNKAMVLEALHHRLTMHGIRYDKLVYYPAEALNMLDECFFALLLVHRQLDMPDEPIDYRTQMAALQAELLYTYNETQLAWPDLKPTRTQSQMLEQLIGMHEDPPSGDLPSAVVGYVLTSVNKLGLAQHTKAQNFKRQHSGIMYYMKQVKRLCTPLATLFWGDAAKEPSFLREAASTKTGVRLSRGY